MVFYKIGEFARLVGVTQATLRNWEKSNILVPHHKTPTGYRFYSQEQLDECLSYGKKKKD